MVGIAAVRMVETGTGGVGGTLDGAEEFLREGSNQWFPTALVRLAEVRLRRDWVGGAGGGSECDRSWHSSAAMASKVEAARPCDRPVDGESMGMSS